MRHKLGRIWGRAKHAIVGNRKRTASFVLALLIPAIIFTWVGLIRPVSFDGAMNLQVAQSLAEHGRYERHYIFANSRPSEKLSGVRAFPSEVETNGPFTVVAAIGILLFGETQLGLQFASVVYVLGVAAIIWWVLKRWLIVATFAPALVLLSLPTTFDTSLGAYGEIPAIFFVLLSFVFVMEAAAKENKSQILKYISLAFVSLGAAYTTKTYLIGALPALIFGMLIIAYGRRDAVKLKEFAVRGLYLAVFPVAYEIFRFISFASLHTYLSWWKNQLKNILAQAGLRHTTGPYAADHKHSLSEKLTTQLHSFIQVSGHFTVIVALLIVGLALVAFALYTKVGKNWAKTFRSTAGLKYGSMVVMLLAMSATYFAWWLVLLPASKAFARRAFPVIVPLEIALVLVAAVSMGVYFSYRGGKNKNRNSTAGQLIAVSYVVVLLFMLLGTSFRTVRGIKVEPYLTLADYRQTINVIDSLPAGTQLYGQNWWSSPVISLMADRNLKNIDTVNVCKLNPADDLIIWDKIASGITKHPTPTTKSLVYSTYRATDSATIYRMSPNPTYCRDGRLIKTTN